MVLMHSSQCQATCIRDVAVYLIARTRKWREMEVEVAPLRRCPARQAAEGDLRHAKRSPDHLHEAGQRLRGATYETCILSTLFFICWSMYTYVRQAYVASRLTVLW